MSAAVEATAAAVQKATDAVIEAAGLSDDEQRAVRAFLVRTVGTRDQRRVVSYALADQSRGVARDGFGGYFANVAESGEEAARLETVRRELTGE